MPLDTMDDLQEKETADLKYLASYVYVSCWTDDDEESIPMWRMYTPETAGVRICLPALPFRMYRNDAELVAEATGMPVQIEAGAEPPVSLRPLHETITKGVVSAQLQTSDQSTILHKIEYTDDQSLLHPKTFSEDGGHSRIDFGALGRHKNTYWSFQREWRFIFTAMKIDIASNLPNLTSEVNHLFSDVMNGKRRQPFPYYDLEIGDEAFTEMRITLSPQLSTGNRIIVDSLVKRFNPNAVVAESCLYGLI